MIFTADFLIRKNKKGTILSKFAVINIFLNLSFYLKQELQFSLKKLQYFLSFDNVYFFNKTISSYLQNLKLTIPSPHNIQTLHF